MALIKCPECGKEISDKADVCIGCGFPLSKMESFIQEETIEPFPNLPSDLDIGSGEWNWTGDAVINLKHVKTPQCPHTFNPGFFNLHRHKKGLCYGSTFNIHESQIIDIYTIDGQVEVSKDGNVVSGAVLGGLLFGGVGAIVGGLAGANSHGKTEVFNKSLCLKFWDVRTKKKIEMLFVSYESHKFDKFITACKESFRF